MHQRSSGAQGSEMCRVDALLPLERRCEVASGPWGRRWSQRRPEALEATLISAG